MPNTVIICITGLSVGIIGLGIIFIIGICRILRYWREMV